MLFSHLSSTDGNPLAAHCRTPEEVQENARIAWNVAPFDDERMQKLERQADLFAAQLTAYKKLPLISLE